MSYLFHSWAKKYWSLAFVLPTLSLIFEGFSYYYVFYIALVELKQLPILLIIYQVFQNILILE